MFVSSDENRWSSVNAWSRKTASRSSRSVRSWCSIVGTDACSRAMWASIAAPMRSRNRRCTRSLTRPTYQVAVADAARPAAATNTAVRSPSSTPSVRSFSQSASKASGSIISSVVASEATSSRGSIR